MRHEDSHRSHLLVAAGDMTSGSHDSVDGDLLDDDWDPCSTPPLLSPALLPSDLPRLDSLPTDMASLPPPGAINAVDITLITSILHRLDTIEAQQSLFTPLLTTLPTSSSPPSISSRRLVSAESPKEAVRSERASFPELPPSNSSPASSPPATPSEAAFDELKCRNALMLRRIEEQKIRAKRERGAYERRIRDLEIRLQAEETKSRGLIDRNAVTESLAAREKASSALELATYAAALDQADQDTMTLREQMDEQACNEAGRSFAFAKIKSALEAQVASMAESKSRAESVGKLDREAFDRSEMRLRKEEAKSVKLAEEKRIVVETHSAQMKSLKDLHAKDIQAYRAKRDEKASLYRSAAQELLSAQKKIASLNQSLCEWQVKFPERKAIWAAPSRPSFGAGAPSLSPPNIGQGIVTHTKPPLQAPPPLRAATAVPTAFANLPYGTKDPADMYRRRATRP